MRKIDPKVIAAAQAAQRATGVPASVSIAQFAIESAWGTRVPPGTNNYFGIKAPHGGGVEAETTEVINGKPVHEEQPFAKFASVAEAFMAHARLLADKPIYAPAMAALPDIQAFVKLMAKHYATDPRYAMKLLGIIHIDGLERFDV